MHGLQAHWAGRPQTAIEYVSKVLAEEPNHPRQFAFYRLWIEALAEMNSRDALASLGRHLAQRAQEEENLHRHINYMALRGLIHLELDQMQAARLMERALGAAKGNPYALEFRQILAQRVSSSEAPALLSAQGSLSDYFHWQTLARGLFLRGEREALHSVLDRVDRNFNGSPMRQVFELHQCIEEGNLERATVVSTELARRMPGHPDYDVIAAWSALHSGQIEVAEERLGHALKVSGEGDVDVMALAGHVAAIRAWATGDKEIVEAANQYLAKASAMLRNLGLPFTRSAMNAAAIQERAQESNDGATEAAHPGRAWLMKLSPRRYCEIRTEEEPAITQIARPMGGAARPGDLVFFAGDLPNGYAPDREGAKNWWNIAAIYTVASEPVWDPIHRQQSVLQLVSRPNEPIPVEVFMMDEEKTVASEEVDLDHPYRYGVFELEGGALDIIMEAIKGRRYKHEGETLQDEIRKIS